MELPLVSASLGAIGSLTGKLDALQDADLKVEFRKLRDGLVLLSEALDPPETARIWMKDVREMSYDMENCVDAAEPDWIHRMSGFKARAKEANEQYNRYMLGSIPIRTPTTATEFQLPTVDGQRRTTIVGLDDGPFGALCQWLTHNAQQLKVASILGVGGIGKTTLAQQLWREHKPGGYFACRAFVRTAKKPDMRRILRSILAQVRPHQPPNTNEVHELIHHIRQHLQGKRYFLIIDDLWATSVWDIARRAFPDSTGSRIITTTEMKKVALACCSYQSKHIFEMEPLSVSHSKELFMSGVLGLGEEKFRQLDQVREEIIRRCAGLPLAIISISSVVASQGGANTVQSWKQIQKQLPTNTTPVEVLKQALNFCYHCLPSFIQTCLLYLSIYPENYMILKGDIVKQWVAEDFIIAPTENDKMKVAGNYFDKLVSMGLIQKIDVNYSNEVYYYAVHPMVHSLITSKSTDENFMTVIDYSKRTVGFSNKVSRLSLQFGSATYASTPESMGLSQIRSLAFIGLKSCYSSILELKVLRFLILHMWADEASTTGVDLKPTSGLVLLRSLQVTCNDTVHLPDLMDGPKHLETLEINARVAAIPANIVHLRSWVHLRLGVGTEVPDLTGTLKIVTLNSHISLDDSSCSPDLVKSLKTMELLSPICIIPKWIEQLANLCTLKLILGELQSDDISILQRMPSLTVLSLHVQRRTTEPISFGTGAFSALEYFEFRCAVLRLRFQKGTMPNLQMLKLGFNAHRGEEYGGSLVGVEGLSNLEEVTGMIGSAAGTVERDLKAAESAFKKAMGRHLNVSVERADMVEELDVPAEKQHEIPEEPPSKSSEKTEIPKQEYLDLRGPAEKQHEIPEDPLSKSSEQTGVPKQEYQHLRGPAEKQHLTRGEHIHDYLTKIKQYFSSYSPFHKRSGPTKLRIKGNGELHILDQVLVSNKKIGLEKLTLERCPPLELKHLRMLTTLKTLIVKDSDGLVGSLGGQGDVAPARQFPVWFPKLQELEISNCPEFSSLIPMSWIESLHLVRIRQVKLLEEFTYSNSFDGAELKIIGEGDLHSFDQVLVFDKETSLAELTLEKCPPLELKHLLMLTSLKRLVVGESDSLVGPLGGDCDVEWQLPVEYVKIDDLRGNSGKELTELLPHLPKLSKLEIRGCKNIKKLVVAVDVQQTTSEVASEMEGGEITAAAAEEEDDGVLLFPAHLCDSLQELEFYSCPELVLVDPPTLVPGGGGLQALRSLQRLIIRWSPKFLSTFSFSCHIFPSSLQFLVLWDVKGLKTLQPLSNLSSLTTLALRSCGEDLKCEGLQSLLTTGGHLKVLEVTDSPRFFADWDPNPRLALEDAEGGEEQQTQLVSSTLRELRTGDPAGLLAAPICSFLSSSLTKLLLDGESEGVGERFSKEQEDALQLLSSLQELMFWNFKDLQQLPAGLRNLTSLKKLSVHSCPAISSLPNDALSDSLQELYVGYNCSQELKQQCRGLEGTIPEIRIN